MLGRLAETEDGHQYCSLKSGVILSQVIKQSSAGRGKHVALNAIHFESSSNFHCVDRCDNYLALYELLIARDNRQICSPGQGLLYSNRKQKSNLLLSTTPAPIDRLSRNAWTCPCRSRTENCGKLVETRRNSTRAKRRS